MCGTVPPANIETSSPKPLKIKFKANNDGLNGRGFKCRAMCMEEETVTKECSEAFGTRSTSNVSIWIAAKLEG